MDASDLLRGLGETYSPQILQEADEPVSAQELSERLDVPVTTTYRRVSTLTEIGLLEEVDAQVGESNYERTMYRRTVDEIVVRFEGTEMTVDHTARSDEPEPLARVWSDLRRGFSGDD
ncbi:helix-turn-helix domain-containing protein [Halobacteria archaeon AArc-dxtr1]|nr:helix-turn-helix domain-containing protein [Halobacteria archaeon AArc-dxtr1]